MQALAKDIEVTFAERLMKLPPYIFVEIDRKKKEAIARGVDVINLGIGDPDLPTHPSIVRAMAKAIRNPTYHRYPDTEGMPQYRQAVADWYKRRFGVQLDADKEVLTLIGAKEGVGHLPMAFTNPGDVVLIPDPGYPPYFSGTTFAGGVVHFMPLRRENGFLPDLKAIPESVARRAKLMFVNYPNNPTGAVAPIEFYQDVVDFAYKHNIIVAQDNTYSELAFDGYRARSFMEVPGAKEVGIELHSMSKTFSMTGWRLGFAVGNPKVIQGLFKIKANLDSGAFNAVQEASIVGLSRCEEIARKNSKIYQERRDVLVKGLRAAGLDVDYPKASFYVWCPVPKGYDSFSFVAKLIEEMGVVCTPGKGFGEAGEGYVRFALTTTVERLKEAVGRLERLMV